MDSRRRVVWAGPALDALNEALAYIAEESPQGAASVARAALESADSLSTLAERGRVVPEIGRPTIREIFVFRYQLLYRVGSDRVTVIASIHGARDFERWRHEFGERYPRRITFDALIPPPFGLLKGRLVRPRRGRHNLARLL